MSATKQANLTIDRKFSEKWDQFTNYCKENAINRNALIRKMIEEWMGNLGKNEERIYTKLKKKYQPSDLDRPRSWYP